MSDISHLPMVESLEKNKKELNTTQKSKNLMIRIHINHIMPLQLLNIPLNLTHSILQILLNILLRRRIRHHRQTLIIMMQNIPLLLQRIQHLTMLTLTNFIQSFLFLLIQNIIMILLFCFFNLFFSLSFSIRSTLKYL